MPSSRAGGALGGPCWPSSAQLPNKEVSELFAHGLPYLTDTAVLPATFCLACMPDFRAGGALGRQRWPSSAQLPNKEVSKRYAHGLPHSTDTAVLLKTFAWPACRVSGRGVRWAGQGSQV
eukprot:1138583-Pelagomonas_calceolata.AAC.4